MSPDEMIAFEKDIAECFNRGEIRAPIHLSGGNEKFLIKLFKAFTPGDWVFSTWRSHYHALLAGVPPEKVKSAIMNGRSMTLCWPEHHFFSSAIFAGCLPIALGVAAGIKLSGGKERVICFLGDMCSMSGLFHECRNYARGHDLPISWIIENNGISVCTDTATAWGKLRRKGNDTCEYFYKLPYPHSGAGKRVQF